MKSIVWICLFFISINIALADKVQFSVAPYGGILVGSFEQGYDVTGTSTQSNVTLNRRNAFIDGTIYGASFGSKLNGYWKGLIFGIDGRVDVSHYQAFSFDSTSVTLDDYSGLSAMIGLYIGYRFLWGLDVWAGYSPVDLLNISKSNEKNSFTGNNTKFGLGHMFTNYSLNLEYTTHTYSKRDGHTFPFTYSYQGLSIVERELKAEDFLLSLSVPINI